MNSEDTIILSFVQMYLQSSSEKIAQCLMHRHFAIICSRIKRFSPKCSEKITVYQSMQNLYLFSDKQPELHVNMTPLDS